MSARGDGPGVPPRASSGGTVGSAYWASVGVGAFMLVNHCLFSLIVYYVARASTPADGPSSMESYEVFRLVLFAVTVVIFGSLYLLWSAVLRGRRTARLLGGRRGRFTAAFVGAALTTYALSEAANIYGLILFFISRRVVDYAIFFVVSTACYAVFFPRLSRWRARAVELGIEPAPAPASVARGR